MLDRFRKNKHNFLYTLIIFMVVAVMAFFGVSQFTSESSPLGQPAAWVNGDVITQFEVKQAVEQRLLQYQSILGDQYDENLIRSLQLPQQILEQLIQFKLMSQQAEKLGFVVPDEELADFIRALPYFQKEGKFDAELYRRIPNRGVEENRQREQLEVRKFQEYLQDRVRLTNADLQKGYLLRETKIDLKFAKIDFAEIAKTQTPTAADIKKFLADTPEEKIKEHYDSHIKDFTQKAKVKLRQIRVGVPFKASDAQKAEAKTKIDEIAKQITAENFADLAKSKSDDEHAKKGGDLGWVERGTLASQIETAIDSMTVGSVSSPIETPFGYFLVKLEDNKAEVVTPFSEVKEKIVKTLAAESLKAQFEKEKVDLWNKKLAEGKPIEAELSALKIPLKNTGPFALGQNHIPQIGAADEILDGVFMLSQKNPIPPKLFLYRGGYYYVKLDKVESPKIAALDKKETREAVETAVQSTLANELINRWLEGLQKSATIKKKEEFEVKSG